jgi:hypothetical protein
MRLKPAGAIIKNFEIFLLYKKDKGKASRREA